MGYHYMAYAYDGYSDTPWGNRNQWADRFNFYEGDARDIFEEARRDGCPAYVEYKNFVEDKIIGRAELIPHAKGKKRYHEDLLKYISKAVNESMDFAGLTGADLCSGYGVSAAVLDKVLNRQYTTVQQLRYILDILEIDIEFPRKRKKKERQ